MPRHFHTTSLLASAAAFLALLNVRVYADPAPVEIKEGLAISRVASGGRVPTPADAIQDLLVRNALTWPKGGDELPLPGGRSAKWAKVTAGQDGWFQGPALAG